MAVTLHTTRAPGTILTATIYNQDHQNHVLNVQNLIEVLTQAEYDALSPPTSGQFYAIVG